MQVTSILAIYFLFWVMSAFVMLPFGVRTADEAGVEKVPGQADSAPVNFRPGRLALRATASLKCGQRSRSSGITRRRRKLRS